MPFDQIVESSAPVLTPVSMEEIGLTSEPDIVGWPWPKLIPTAYHTLIILEGLDTTLFLYELVMEDSGVWIGTQIAPLGMLKDINSVEVVDFGLYYVVSICGSSVRNFAKLTGSPLVELSAPIFGTGCNNNGQLVAGNISHWQDLSSDGIIWSEIGSYTFDPGVNFTAGFKTLVNGKNPGKRVTVKKILPFTSSNALSATGGVIVYTDFGNVFLTDSIVGNTFTYGLVELEGVGVASGDHVAGNSHTHGFVNLNNEFCRYQRNKEVKVLGYKRQIEDLKAGGSPLIMSFLEDRNTFFLSNGVASLVVNDYGAGMIHQAISGIVKGWDQVVYSTFRDLGDTQGRITLDGNSVDSRGKKTLEWIVVDIDYLPETKVNASSYWRNSSYEEYRDYAWKNGSPSGEFFLGLSAVEYRLAIRFSSYVESEIFGFKVNMKYPDSRTRRGISAISGRERSDAGSQGGT